MGERLDEPLEGERIASLTALEDAVWLAQLGDFRQAALRYAEFRREFDDLDEEGWKWLTRSDAGKFIAWCRSLAARISGK